MSFPTIRLLAYLQIEAQWPLPREQCDVIDAFFRVKHEAGMVRESKSLHSTLTFFDGYNQLLMRASDIPLTVVSTPSGMLWEWLVMSQGLSNAPATFNRLVTQLLRPHRAYAQTYFDDIFVHSHHLRAVLECMRPNKLYANAYKCIFGAEQIPFLGCFIGKRGLRADPTKVKIIVDWPVPKNQTDLHKWLGLTNYLHKYSENYADMARPLSNLLKKDAEWAWDTEHQVAFEAVKESLLHAPILALPDPDRPFSVLPHLSQRMTRWLSFFAEYNFEVKYKPVRQNGLADAQSRRPDYELSHVTTVTSSVTDLIRAAYARDDMCVALLRALESKEFEDSDSKLSARLRARLHRYSLDGLLYYSTDPEDTPRIVVPHDEDLKYRILDEAPDTALSGYVDREKTYGSTSTYVRTCETCQWVKPSPHAAAPLASLPVPSGCWEPMSMDFVFGLPKDSDRNTGIVIFVDRLSKMAHLAAVPDTTDGEGTAKLFIGRVFRQHVLPESIVSDRDPRFTGKFWWSVFKVLGTRLDMSTADHRQTDVSAVFKTKLRPRFIGPLKVVAKKGLAYTLNLPKKMCTHPVFYVGLHKPYGDPARVSAEALVPGRAQVAQPQHPAEAAAPRQTSLKIEDPVRQRSWGLEPVDALPELINLIP
uniref:Integrase catalytic domain-containing protein n=1 Tax=Phytophthora ramorum TaxID=164328 RepID=H3GD69_PHYRM